MDIQEKITAIIQSQIANINEKLVETKLEFANYNLDENEWQNKEDWKKKNDKKFECKIYQAQIEILENTESLLFDLLRPRSMGAAV